jgi:hypothetical protein
MSKAMFRDVTLAGGLFCLSCLLAGCSSVTGTYADTTGSFGLDVQSGGKATMTFMGISSACTYTTSGKQLTLTCPGQPGGEVFTVNSDGSLAPPPDTLIPVLKKTK